MSSFKKNILLSSAMAVALLSSNAHAATFNVSAVDNSVLGGTGGVETGLSFSAGETISGSVDSKDTWTASTTSLNSNFNFTTNADGVDGTNWTHNGLTTAFGTLVGGINNNYFVLGTEFNVTAPETGLLSLFYWDDIAIDNAGLVNVSVNSGVSNVPVPAAVWLFGSGMIGLLGANRKKEKLTVAA